MSETINVKFEIPQGYYTQEELNNYIKNSISNILNNSSVEAYSSTKGNITIPLNKIISNIQSDKVIFKGMGTPETPDQDQNNQIVKQMASQAAANMQT